MNYCGSDCCKDCSRLVECGDCEKCGGHPFGGSCVVVNEKFILVSEYGCNGVEPELVLYKRR